jgi:hypothetical protein
MCQPLICHIDYAAHEPAYVPLSMQNTKQHMYRPMSYMPMAYFI